MPPGHRAVRSRRNSRIESKRRLKKADSLLPEHEGLRRAVSWLIEQPVRDLETIEEASRRFNLSPLDEQFLLDHFRTSKQP